MRQAIQAVEGDSVARRPRALVGAPHSRTPPIAPALLGLATLARLTYDYPAADRLYARLFDADSLHPDSYAAYARLGRAWSFEERGQSDAAGDEFARARRRRARGGRLARPKRRR